MRRLPVQSPIGVARGGPGRTGALLDLWSAADTAAETAVVQVDDLTDANNPKTIGLWSPPTARARSGCQPAIPAVDAELHDDARRALVLLGDGHLYDLDVTGPGAPRPVGDLPPPPDGGLSAFATALPLRDRTVAIVSEVGGSPGCNARPSGLRMVDLDPRTVTREVGQASYGGQGAPAKVVASGESAFAPWRAGGLRVVDLGAPHPRTVAEFTPGGTADVVGVALLSNEILALDRSSGLYILERPAEGGTESFWERAKTMELALVLAGVMGLVVLPRLWMVWSLARRRGGTPVPSPVGSRQR